MKIKCPECGHTFFVDENEFVEGKKKVRCPSCGKVLLIKLKRKKVEDREPKEGEETSSAFDSTPPFDDVTRAEDLFGGGEPFSPSEDLSESFTESDDIFGDLPSPDEVGNLSEESSFPSEENPFESDADEDLFNSPVEDSFDSSSDELFGDIPSFEESHSKSSIYSEEGEEDFPNFDWEDEEEESKKVKSKTPEQADSSPNQASQEHSAIEEEEEEEDEFKPLIDEEEADQILEDAIIREENENNKRKLFSPLTIILIILLIIVSGIFVAYKYFPEKLPVKQYITSLFQPPPEPEPYHNLDHKVIVKTTKTWRLFNIKGDRIVVFQGKAKNIFNKTISYIKLRIYLLGPDKKPVLTKDFYAGNTFTRDELKLISPQQIQEKLNNKFGDTFTNEAVPPGKSIPFMVALVNPPPFSEYRIVTISSLIGE